MVSWLRGVACSGTQSAIAALKRAAEDAGAASARLLKTSGAFHTALMETLAGGSPWWSGDVRMGLRGVSACLRVVFEVRRGACLLGIRRTLVVTSNGYCRSTKSPESC